MSSAAYRGASILVGLFTMAIYLPINLWFGHTPAEAVHGAIMGGCGAMGGFYLARMMEERAR